VCSWHADADNKTLLRCTLLIGIEQYSGTLTGAILVVCTGIAMAVCGAVNFNAPGAALQLTLVFLVAVFVFDTHVSAIQTCGYVITVVGMSNYHTSRVKSGE
jgi:tRNA-binding EMAP/Myf-like protein